MEKNCWILGGTGFIGHELVKYLAETQRYRLHLLVHQNIPFRELENHALFTGNLEDFDWSWLKKYPPAVIFHMARLGGSNSITRNLSSIKGAKANERLIDFLKDQAHPPLMVYVSGSLMYGPQEEGRIADENSAWNPVSYARYYFMGEKPWLNEQYYGTMDIRFARPGWIVGKGSWLKTFYLKPFLETGSIPLYGDGTQLMSLIHVEDCSRLVTRLAEMGKKKQNLNIMAGPPVTQQKFAELLAAQLNTQVQRVPYEMIRKNYGQTVTEALTASIPMTTTYPELYAGFEFRYPDARSIVESISSFFKYEQRIFSKTP
ncbi:MAG TPA: NAD(P)-dependent oxidoreductase [Prolixibacteraceae bacterium]|nr:NAD(P)-dependent oxidoreductase [Prolixibacteraceae bacterium]